MIHELRSQIDAVQRNLLVAQKSGATREMDLHRARLEDLIDIAERHGITVTAWVDQSIRMAHRDPRPDTPRPAADQHQVAVADAVDAEDIDAEDIDADDVDAEAPDTSWLDRLVELHVLTAHGDTASAAAAKRWLATDLKARQVWESVEQVCRSMELTEQGSTGQVVVGPAR